MKIVRKFNDFVKVRINEDVLPQETMETQPGIDATEMVEDPANIIEEPEEGYEEEESGDTIESMMNELTEELGAQKNGNVIEYEGHKIEFYSETNSFAIDGKVDFMMNGKKMKLKTVEDVKNYLMNQQVPQAQKELEPALESRRFKRHKAKRK
jgi:hypothetical protein